MNYLTTALIIAKELQVKEITSKYLEERNQYEKQIRQLEGKLHDLEEDGTPNRSADRKGTMNWREKYNQLQSQMDGNIKEVKAQIEKTKKAEMDALLKQLQLQSQTEVAALQGRIKQYEDQLAALSEKNSKLSTKVNKLQQELQDKDDEIQTLQSNLENSEAQQEDVPALKNEIKELKEQLRSARNEISKKDLEIKNLKVKGEIQESEKKNELEELMKKQKRELSKSMDKLEIELQQQETENEELRKKISQFEGEIASLKKELNDERKKSKTRAEGGEQSNQKPAGRMNAESVSEYDSQ